jgi:hypothetical protein
MSLDLEAYFIKAPEAAARHGARAGAGWLLNVEEPLRIEKDDLAPELRSTLSRCRWRVDIHLEGAASDEAIAAMEALSRRLIEEEAAWLHDPQAGTLSSRAGTWPVLAGAAQEEGGFQLAVFFERADQIDRPRYARFLDVVAAELPEALPHRYGEFEPFQGRWAEGGKAAFLEQWDPLDPPFWSGKTPAAHGYCSFHHPVAPREAFRAGMIEIEFRPALARDPAKLAAALRLTEQAALCVGAFYAALVPKANDHGPWWKGLYPGPHLALVLGPPLLACWPEFEALSVPLGDHHRAAGRLHGNSPVVPPEPLSFPLEPIEPELLALARGKTHRPANAYAPVFPFPKRDPYS